MPHPELLTEDEEESLRGIAAILRRHGMESRFGACLVQEDPSITTAEEIIETVDSRNREEVRSVVEVGKFSGAIETEWQFSVRSTTVAAACVIRCWDQDRMKHGRMHVTG